MGVTIKQDAWIVVNIEHDTQFMLQLKLITVEYMQQRKTQLATVSGVCDVAQ